MPDRRVIEPRSRGDVDELRERDSSFPAVGISRDSNEGRRFEGKELLAEVRRDFIDVNQRVIQRELLINILFSRLLFHTMPMILLCILECIQERKMGRRESKGKNEREEERKYK